MNYMKKLGYLKGLADGLNPDHSTVEGKLIKALIDVVEEMASALSELEESVTDVEEQLDDLYEELGELAEDLEDARLQDENFSDNDKDNIRMFRRGGKDRDDDENEGDEEVYRLVCPACQGEILLEEDDLTDDVIICPNCKAQLELDAGCDCCGCGCDHDYADDDEEKEDK